MTIIKNSFPEDLLQEMASMQEKMIAEQVAFIDKKLLEFMTPYLVDAGLKGELTKGKAKWHGIKMKCYTGLDKTTYQLTQRGKNISPVFTVNYDKSSIEYCPFI